MLKNHRKNTIVRAFYLSLLCGALTASCGSWDLDNTHDPGTCPTGDVIARGQVVRIYGTYNYNGPFKFGTDSAARIEISSIPANSVDIPSTFVAAQIFRPITEVPFSFCITGTIPSHPESYDFLINAEVRQYMNMQQVGDLMSEVSKEIELPAQDLTIQVSGLEKCGSENSDDYCL